MGRTSAYIRKRKAWLASIPHHLRRCCYCDRPVIIGARNDNPLQATVEHSVEVDRGLVDPLDASLWRLSCRSCNSRRGAQYGNGERTTSEAW